MVPDLTHGIAGPLTAQGDLFDAVKRSGGRMPEAALVQQVLYPYLCSLLYLHSRGIIHRDIKPENTVFTREMVLKITGKGGCGGMWVVVWGWCR